MEIVITDADKMRSLRNMLLTRCDWTQLPDADITSAKKTAWANYRQALRDIPEQYPDGKDIIWPEVPT